MRIVAIDLSRVEAAKLQFHVGAGWGSRSFQLPIEFLQAL